MTAAAPPPLRWWGWGERDVAVPPGLLLVLREQAGVEGSVVSRAPSLESVRLPDAALPAALRAQLVAAVGGLQVRDDLEERVRHAAGRSYLDLLRLRSGVLEAAPDAVVHPASSEEIAEVLRACADHRCAVVPFGGGTSVVGGVNTPARKPCIVVDVDRLDALRAVDTVSMLATLQAGMRGPRIESELNARGFTLGHFPQSFEFATAGGFAATRSSGQASAGYGRFDTLVRGLHVVTPADQLDMPPEPPSATGPSLLQLMLGSEGTLGVITDATVRVRPRPASRRYTGWSFPDFEHGVAAFRELAQRRGALPDVMRLSDATESRVGFAMSDSQATRAAQRYLQLRGHRAACLAILGWEGEVNDVHRRVRATAPGLRRHGGITLGGAPGRAWRRDRFAAPYLRDALLDRGVLVETVETATTWSGLTSLRAAVTEALHRSLQESGSWPLIGCHVSHIYPEGASLYVTVLARQVGDAQAQWRSAKEAVTEAILRAGGVLSHHHGVGRDHALWYERAAGGPALAAVRAARSALDPSGIMNPGVL